MILKSKSKTLDLSRPHTMGILNVTPDSFSDGGRFNQMDAALRHAEEMLAAGTSILDIGGESTRPGADEVSLEQELDRVVPVIEALRQRFDCWISIDTSKAKVMTEAVNAGADLINDVRASGAGSVTGGSQCRCTNLYNAYARATAYNAASTVISRCHRRCR